MLVRALGALELEGGGLRRPKPLLLLTYLSLEGPRTRRQLSETFWLGAANPLASLSMALSQLRGAVPELIHTEGEYVRTDVGCDARLLLRALEARDLPTALNLYRGPFLDGFHLRGWAVELEEWVHDTREVLAARLSSAMLDHADGLAASGSFEEAADRAETAMGLAGVPPLEPDELERAYLLLKAGGSPVAARVREEARELGLELAATRTDARSKLERPRDALAALQLPMQPTPFFGRMLELTEIGGRLERRDCRLLTLVGPGGVGKSRLALAAARQQLRARSLATAAWFVDLAEAKSGREVLEAVQDALDIDPVDGTSPLERLRERVGHSEALIVLDGFEHVADEAECLAALLNACTGVRLVVTSRQRLGLAVEEVYVVDGLDVPGDGVTPSDAARFDAVALFAHRAKRAEPGFELNAETLPGVLRACRLVEGLPLAIELAAAWARVLPVDEIADELERGLDMLSTSASDVNERHRSIRSAFDRSWSLLDDAERRALLRLGAFRGGFRRVSAGSVAGTTLPLLATLVDKSLLRKQVGGRFGFHPLLESFVREKLREGPEDWRAAREAHARHFADEIRRWHAMLLAGEREAARTQFDADRANVRAAWRFLSNDWPAGEVRELVQPLRSLLDVRKSSLEAAGLFEEALETARDPSLIGTLLVSQAWLVHQAGEHFEARSIAERAAWLLDRADAPLEAAKAHNVRASAAWFLGDFDTSREAWELALDAARERGATGDAATYAANLALAHQALGDFERAKDSLEASLAAFLELRDEFHVVHTLTKLGVLQMDAGDVRGAEKRFEEALLRARADDLEEEVPRLLVNLGIVAYERGSYRRSIAMTEEALAALEHSDDRYLVGYSQARLGWALTRAGEHAAAQVSFERALETGSGIPPAELEAVGGVARLLIEMGDALKAVELLAFLRGHDAVEQADKDRHSEVLDQLRDAVSGSGFDRAVGRGASITMDDALAAAGWSLGRAPSR